MNLKNKNVGWVFTGSFGTFSKTIEQLKNIINEGANIIPIMSDTAYNSDTKFGNSKKYIEEIKNIVVTEEIIHSMEEVEALGCKGLTDTIVIAPATGNTIAKLANGITDSIATLAIKSHLRDSSKPVVIGISTTDALSTNAENIRKTLEQEKLLFYTI